MRDGGQQSSEFTDEKDVRATRSTATKKHSEVCFHLSGEKSRCLRLPLVPYWLWWGREDGAVASHSGLS